MSYKLFSAYSLNNKEITVFRSEQFLGVYLHLLLFHSGILKMFNIGAERKRNNHWRICFVSFLISEIFLRSRAAKIIRFFTIKCFGSAGDEIRKQLLIVACFHQFFRSKFTTFENWYVSSLTTANPRSPGDFHVNNWPWFIFELLCEMDPVICWEFVGPNKSSMAFWFFF